MVSALYMMNKKVKTVIKIETCSGIEAVVN